MRPHPIPMPFGFGAPEARLRHLKRLIAAGWALDLNDAVRLNAQLLPNARHADRDHSSLAWGHRTAIKDRRRWEHYKCLVLRKAKSCAFCPGRAIDITYAKPLPKGGKDRLRNLLPVCDVCYQLWPQVRRDLPYRVRDKLAEELILQWGCRVRRP